MFCKNCGKQLPDGSRFCSACGTTLDSSVQPAPQSTNPNGSTFSVTDENGRVIDQITYTELQDNIARAYELCAKFYNLELSGQTDELEGVTDEMEKVFKRLSPFSNAWLEKEYLNSLGVLSQLMAKYYCEYFYNPDEGAEYADTAVEVLKKYLGMYGDSLDDKAKLRTNIAYALAREYCAYIAYNQNYLDYAIQVLQDMPTTPLCLAIVGSCMCLIANSKNDYQMVRNSMAVFEEMDKMITAPPKDKMDQDIYRAAYGWYGLMLAKNPDTYPEGGFTRNIPKAIYAINRGISLMTEQEFVDMLQPDLDEYTAML